MSGALRLGARDQQGRGGVVDADEGQHQSWRVMRGQFLIEHNLFGHRHAAAPLGRPVRHRVPGLVQFGEPPLLERDEFGVADSGLGCAPIGGDVRGTPGPNLGTELLEVGAHVYNPVSPRVPTVWVRWSRVADSPNGSRRSGWLYRDSQDSVVSSQNPTAPCS